MNALTYFATGIIVLLVWFFVLSGDFKTTVTAQYCPEAIEIVEGEIVHIVPYLSKGFSRHEAHYRHPRPLPISIEGVDVIIAYQDTQGRTRILDESWKLPALDLYDVGDSMPILWHKFKLKPYSLLGNESNLRKSLRLAAEGKLPKETTAQREKRREQLSELFEKHAAYFDRCSVYYETFFENRDEWKWSEPSKQRDEPLAEYLEEVEERLRLVREQLQGVTVSGMETEKADEALAPAKNQAGKSQTVEDSTLARQAG